MKGLAVLLLLAACSEPAPTAAVQAPAPTAPVPSPMPTSKTPLDAEQTDPALTTPEAAANVVRAYFSLMDAGRYAEAWALWGEQEASEQFRLDVQKAYQPHHTVVGTPGDQEGAAGSSYIRVPVELTVVLNSGEIRRMSGKVFLRRVNDVPGSTAQQRRWHITSIETKPAS
jgi:hypothetical protein